MMLMLWAPLCLTTIAEPYLGVLIWAWAALVKPNDYLYGFMAGFPFDKSIAILTLIVLFVTGDVKRFVISRSTVYIIVLALIGFSSSIFGIGILINPWTPYVLLLKVLLLCIVLDNTMAGRTRIHSLLLVIAIGLGLGTTTQALKFLRTGGNYNEIGMWSGGGDNNIYAVAVLMSLPVTLYLYSYSRAKTAKIGFLLVTGLSIIAIVGTFSRGALIGLLAMCAYLVARSGKRIFAATILVCGAGLCIWLVAPERWFERAGTITTAEQDSSFEGRVTAWKVSLMIALDRPLTGAGFDALQDPTVWNKYASELPFPTSTEAMTRVRAAHSIYFETLGDLGFPGTALLLLILLNGFTTGWAIRRATRTRPNLKWAADLAFALELSLVGYAVAGGGLSLAYNEKFYVFVTILSAVKRTVLSEVAAEGLIAQSRGPAHWSGQADPIVESGKADTDGKV
jgi:putative inorganic carbon (hco3(-)) transporter